MSGGGAGRAGVAAEMWSNLPLFPEQASSFAGRIDALYYFLVGVSALFTGLIFLLLLYFSVKYRRRPGGELAKPVQSSIALEVIWMVIPLGIAMVMFVWGAREYVTLSSPPENALQMYVIGKQWMWKFQHLDGQREINELHVPVGRPVKLTMTSQDVIHSFYVPAFRVKQDVLPGRYTTVWFEATKTGSYHLFCAEYCGTQHSGMIGQVIVMEPAEYEAWLSGAVRGAPAVGQPPSVGPLGSLAAQGEKLFQQLACNACHRMDTQGVCPVLMGLYGRSVRLQSGATVLADENYLRESILDPGAQIVANFQPVMPSFRDRVSDEDLLALIEYIKSLSRPLAPVPPRAVPAGERPGR